MPTQNLNPEDIQTVGGAPAVEPAPVESPAPAGGTELPDELLQEPVMQALMAGSPPAASANIKTAAESALGQLIGQHSQSLQQAGFGFYRSQDGNLGVLFNQLRINPQEIVQADQQGRLLDVAPPIEQVEQAILSSGDQNPALLAEGPTGAATPPVPQGGAPTGVPAAGGRVAQALFNERKQNLNPGSPTSGPRPGAGRVLNAILSPVV